MRTAAHQRGAPCEDVSTLLRTWSDADQSAIEKLTPIVYEELHRLARRSMKRERLGHRRADCGFS